VGGGPLSPAHSPGRGRGVALSISSFHQHYCCSLNKGAVIGGTPAARPQPGKITDSCLFRVGVRTCFCEHVRPNMLCRISRRERSARGARGLFAIHSLKAYSRPLPGAPNILKPRRTLEDCSQTLNETFLCFLNGRHPRLLTSKNALWGKDVSLVIKQSEPDFPPSLPVPQGARPQKPPARASRTGWSHGGAECGVTVRSERAE